MKKPGEYQLNETVDNMASGDGVSSVDSAISSGNDSDTERNTNCEHDEMIKKDPILAENETRRVVLWRWLLFFFLIAAVAAASALTHVVLTETHDQPSDEAVSQDESVIARWNVTSVLL